MVGDEDEEEPAGGLGGDGAGSECEYDEGGLYIKGGKDEEVPVARVGELVVYQSAECADDSHGEERSPGDGSAGPLSDPKNDDRDQQQGERADSEDDEAGPLADVFPGVEQVVVVPPESVGSQERRFVGEFDRPLEPGEACMFDLFVKFAEVGVVFDGEDDKYGGCPDGDGEDACGDDAGEEPAGPEAHAPGAFEPERADDGKERTAAEVEEVTEKGGGAGQDNVALVKVRLEESPDGEGKNGEIELEQAFIEHDLNDTTRLRAGLFLVPVGLLNETHEPPTFYGVERNNVEKNIIPTTWWEGGVALNGELAPGVNYDVAFSSGLALDADAGKFRIRDGRQKLSEADASKGAFTASMTYNGVPGLRLGGAVHYQQDLYQGNFSHDIDALLVELHLAYNNGPFGLRALAASWDIDDDIERIQLGADTQEGWYVEPSFKVTRDIGLFARYSQWDNQAGGGGDTEFEQYDIGVNYWLEDNVVFKLDYQVQETPDSEKELDGFNLGVGFNF